MNFVGRDPTHVYHQPVGPENTEPVQALDIRAAKTGDAGPNVRMAPEHVGLDANAVVVGQFLDPAAEVIRAVAHAAKSEPRAQPAAKRVVPPLHRFFTFFERFFGVFTGQIFRYGPVSGSVYVQGRPGNDSPQPR